MNLPGGPFALAERLARCREVDVLDGGVGGLFRLVELRKAVDAFVGHVDDADVRLIGRAVDAHLGAAPRDRVEDGCLAGTGKADDAKLHSVRVDEAAGNGEPRGPTAAAKPDGLWTLQTGGRGRKLGRRYSNSYSWSVAKRAPMSREKSRRTG